MQVIPPATISTSQLTSSTVPEEVAATYNGGTTYALGALAGAASTYGSPQTVWRSKQNGNTGNAQAEGAWWTEAGTVYPVYNSGSSCGIGGIVTDLATHSLYESLVSSNTGNALTDTTKWEYIGKTNRYRMFDYTRSQPTTALGSITVVVAPGVRCDSFAITGLGGSSYTLSVSSVTGGGVVYTSSGTLSTRESLTWSDYFFGTFGTKESIAFFDVPLYSDSIFTLTITATSGNASCGAAVFGRYVYIGETQYSATSDMLNFSSVERDADGNAVLTQRKNVPQTEQTVWIDKARVEKVKVLRRELDGVPAFWYGVAESEDGWFELFAVLGVCRGFPITALLPEKAVATIKVEQI